MTGDPNAVSNSDEFAKLMLGELRLIAGELARLNTTMGALLAPAAPPAAKSGDLVKLQEPAKGKK